MQTRLTAFVTDEHGAASTRNGFFVAAAIGVIVMSVYLMAYGGEPPERPAGPTPEEMALAELTNGQIRTFDSRTTARRLALYSDPTEFTPAQLRNAHRTWSRRMEDRTYPDRDLAADMALITATALELRGIRPHQDI